MVPWPGLSIVPTPKYQSDTAEPARPSIFDGKPRVKDLSSSAKGFGRILLFTLQAGQGKTFPGSYLIHCTEGEGADSKQEMVDSLSPNTAAFPTLRQRSAKWGFAGESGSPAAMGQQSLADALSGKPKSSFVPFPLSPTQWHDSAGVKCFNGIQHSFCCPPAPRPFHPSLGARSNSQEESTCCVLH